MPTYEYECQIAVAPLNFFIQPPRSSGHVQSVARGS